MVMITAILTNRGLEVNWAEFIALVGGTDKFKKTILNKLNVHENPKHGKQKDLFATQTLKPYMSDAKFIIFPKILQHGFLKNYLAIEQPVLPNLRHFSYESMLDFYDYQEAAATYAAEYLRTKHAIYVQLETGMGKTMMSIALIIKLGVPTLFIAPTIALADQFEADVLKAIPSIKMGRYSNMAKKQPNFSTHDIITIVDKTCSTKDYAFFEGCGLAIADELHSYASKTRIEILWLLQCVPNILGMSATPQSSPSGLDIFPMRFFGPPHEVKNMPGIDLDLGTFKVMVKKIEYCGDVTMPWCTNVIGKMGMLSAIGTIVNMSHDAARNQMIVNEILRLRAENHGVMVFSELRNHLSIIETLLYRNGVDANDVELNEISILKGGTSADSMEITKKSGAHTVLTTYGYSRFGISLINMTALVLATPHRHGIEQVIGRILRKGSDESKIREIVDIVDINLVLKSQYQMRKKTYNTREYPIKTEKVLYSDVDYSAVDFTPPAAEEVPDDEEYDRYIASLKL